MAPRAVEIYSMTKSYNMGGWRVGFCLGNRLIPALARIKSYLDYGIFQPIQIASIIALRECEEAPGKICTVYEDEEMCRLKACSAQAGRWSRLKARCSSGRESRRPLRRDGLLRLREIADERSARSGLARHRVWSVRRRVRSFQPDREQTTRAAGYKEYCPIPRARRSARRLFRIARIIQQMAARLDVQLPEIVELGGVPVGDLDPLLSEEIGVWEQRLAWDFRPSADLLRRFLQIQSLYGFGLVSGKEVIGYAYHVCEGRKGLIGDFYVRRAYASPSHEMMLWSDRPRFDARFRGTPD